MNLPAIIARNSPFSFPFAMALALPLIMSGCERREIRWAAVKGDVRDLPAKAASIGKAAQGKTIVRLVPAEGPEVSALDMISRGSADAGYVDARKALAAMARGEADIEIVAVTYRDARGEPERLLVVNGEWARKNPQTRGIALREHRAAVRFLEDNDSTALSLLSEWTNLSKADCRKVLSRMRWESSEDVADLIDLLDELRRAGDISGVQAEALALRLLEQKP